MCCCSPHFVASNTLFLPVGLFIIDVITHGTDRTVLDPPGFYGCLVSLPQVAEQKNVLKLKISHANLEQAYNHHLINVQTNYLK